jgi:hypothetical protein
MTTAEARHDPRARDFDFLLGSWAVRHSRLAHRLVGADDWERRFVWDRITPTSARWQQAFSIDDERSWETNWIMEFSRAPDPSE